jgi:putative NADH-flavin reductase
MKNIIIFGSTGTIGQHLIKQALELGYQVTAFTRNKNNVDYKHNRLNIVEGNVLDVASVEKAIQGHEIVICALGAGRKGVVRSEGTRIIIKAMQKTGVKRLICQSTLGAGDSFSTLTFFWKNIMFGWFLKEAFMDHQLQEEYVLQSNLDWIIVRPAGFTNGKKTGSYKHGFAATDKSLKLKISRSDVAQFVLKQIDNNSYLHKTPGLSY